METTTTEINKDETTTTEINKDETTTTETNKDETTKNNTETRYQFEFTVGIILLIPPIISVLAFLLQFAEVEMLKNFEYADIWVGDAYESGGFTSAMPFYLGLMAIAGALLISHSKK